MKYGKLDNIEGVDFSLPQDHAQTARVLSTTPKTELKSFAGGTMWNIPSWKGKIFPEKTPAKAMIERYGEQFGTLELNATHYRIHPPSTTRKWADAMPDDFIFCPKFPQLISHFRRFNNCEGLTDEFIEAILAFGDKLGPSFIQLPPNFAPHHGERLINYLQTWPRELRLAVEFRHPGWFMGESDAEAVWSVLEALGIGAVISDTAGRRDAVHMRCTAPFLILRFGGYDLDPTDAKRLNDWALRLREWHSGGLDSVYLLVHQPDSITTPETCILFAEKIEAALGVKTKVPQLIKGNTLF